MSKLVLYRQLRRDGGIRTGIEIDGETAYGLFEEGEADDDPRLRWFVDLRGEGPKAPKSARGARKWLLDHGDLIRDGYARFAEEIRAGVDPDIPAASWSDFSPAPEGIALKIVASASRRQDAIELAAVVGEIGAHWERIVRSLKPAYVAPRH